MTCIDLYGEEVTAVAREHIASCKDCRKLYVLDRQLEDRLSSELKAVDPPRNLTERLRRQIDEKNERHSWFTPYGLHLGQVVPSLAVAGLLVLMMINPFSSRQDTIGAISAYAPGHHLNPDTIMVFSGGDLDIKLSGDTTYSLEKPHHLIRLWTENELIYITVQSA